MRKSKDILSEAKDLVNYWTDCVNLNRITQITHLKNIELAPLYSISAIFMIAAQEWRMGIEHLANTEPKLRGYYIKKYSI